MILRSSLDLVIKENWKAIITIIINVTFDVV